MILTLSAEQFARLLLGLSFLFLALAQLIVQHNLNLFTKMATHCFRSKSSKLGKMVKWKSLRAPMGAHHVVTQSISLSCGCQGRKLPPHKKKFFDIGAFIQSIRRRWF